MSDKTEDMTASAPAQSEVPDYFSLGTEEILPILTALRTVAEAAHAAGQEGDREAVQFRNRLIKLYNKFIDSVSINQEPILK